jgi:transposase-like protein
MIEPQDHRVSRRRSREEAALLVLEYEQSGLRRQAFCRQHGLSVATLDNYRKRSCSLDAAVTDAVPSSPNRPAITLVPLELVEQPAIARQEVCHGATLFVELAGGRRIAVVSGFDALTLTRLIAVLEPVTRCWD